MLTCQILVRFWCKYPALLYGVAVILGLYSFFCGPLPLLIPIMGLWLPFLISIYFGRIFLWKPLLLSFTLFCACWSYAALYYVIPNPPKEGIKGLAYVSIESIHTRRSFFGSKWVYRCQLNHFYPESHPLQSIAGNIKCIVAFPDRMINRPPAHHDYLIPATLIKTDQNLFILKISTLSPWKAVQGSWSIAEGRYQWKKQVQDKINGYFSDPLSAIFLGGLATGDFDDQWLHGEFARFGLQHIMAISGFHFAIVMGILSLLSRFFLSRKRCAWLLLFLMGGYAFFLGANPSIMRAWIMCTLVIVGFLIEKNARSLNSLGIALIAVALYDPLLCRTMGFQFSFLTTAAILLIYAPLNHYLGHVFIQRPLGEVVEMNACNQHGYCILAFFKQGLALMCAVNLFAFPLTLYYFHQFPWISLFYNLFFPFLISVSMGLLIFGFMTAWIPLLGTTIHSLNNLYTQRALKLTYGLPKALDHYATIENFPAELLVVYLTFMLIAGIVCSEKNSEADNEFGIRIF